MTHVLVAGDEHTGTLATVRGLRARGYAPLLALPRPGGYAAYSRAVRQTIVVPDPELTAEAYVSALADEAERERAAALLPASEAAVHALAGREGALPDGVELALPPRAVVERVTSKTILAELAAAVGLESPPALEASRDEVAAQAAELGFPVIVKPAFSIARTDAGELLTAEVVRAGDAASLERELATIRGERFVVQPYLSGRLYAVGAVAWDGRLACSAHQLTLRTWPVDAGGSSYAVTVARDVELDARIEQLVALSGWQGLFQLQFMQAAGRRYVIDFNPRPYGSMGLVVAAGLNLPAIWTDLLLGRQPEIPRSYRVGLRYRVEEDDARAIVRLARRGDRSALAGLLPRRPTAHAVFSARDPGPLRWSFAKLVSRASGAPGRARRRGSTRAR